MDSETSPIEQTPVSGEKALLFGKRSVTRRTPQQQQLEQRLHVPLGALPAGVVNDLLDQLASNYDLGPIIELLNQASPVSPHDPQFHRLFRGALSGIIADWKATQTARLSEVARIVGLDDWQQQLSQAEERPGQKLVEQFEERLFRGELLTAESIQQETIGSYIWQLTKLLDVEISRHKDPAIFERLLGVEQASALRKIRQSRRQRRRQQLPNLHRWTAGYLDDYHRYILVWKNSMDIFLTDGCLEKWQATITEAVLP